MISADLYKATSNVHVITSGASWQVIDSTKSACLDLFVQVSFMWTNSRRVGIVLAWIVVGLTGVESEIIIA